MEQLQGTNEGEECGGDLGAPNIAPDRDVYSIQSLHRTRVNLAT